jgi:hypothetical protein
VPACWHGARRVVDRDTGAAQAGFNTASSSARNVSSLAVSKRTTCRFRNHHAHAIEKRHDPFAAHLSEK